MISYRMINGVCIEVRSVADGYLAQQGETVVAGDILPTRQSLSDPSAWAAGVMQGKSLTVGTLSAVLIAAKVVTQEQIDAAVNAVSSPVAQPVGAVQLTP